MQVESGKISNVVDAQTFQLVIAEVKYLRTWNFPRKCPPSTSSSWGKDFENRLNTFGARVILLAQCSGWKLQNFKIMLSLRKVFTLPLQKCNTCAPETFHHNVQPQDLRAEANISKIGWMPLEIQYFSWHSVQVERCKISNVVDAQSIQLAIAKVKYLRTWNFPPKCPPSTSSSWDEDFENRFNTFGDIGFLLAQCTGWKWQNFKWCRFANYWPFRWKSKIPAHLKNTTQMATLNIFDMKQTFRKSVDAFGYIGYWLAQCAGWKWKNFKCCRCAKYSTCHCKSVIPAHLKLSTTMPNLKIFELRQRFRKSVECLWR